MCRPRAAAPLANGQPHANPAPTAQELRVRAAYADQRAAAASTPETAAWWAAVAATAAQPEAVRS